MAGTGASVEVTEFGLVDVPVRVEVPADVLDLLTPYPTRPSLGRAPALRVVVRQEPVETGLWQVLADTEATCPPEELATTLLSSVNVGVLRRTNFLAIHAGVVGTPTGGIAFPGGSEAGKSTLTAACLRQGLTYVSDEALCIDLETGLVQPFLRPLALSPTSLELIQFPSQGGRWNTHAAELVLSPRQLGAHTAQDPIPLRHVVITTRQPGPASLSPAPRRDAVRALLAHAFNHFRTPASAFGAAYQAAAEAAVWHLVYADPLAGADLICGLS